MPFHIISRGRWTVKQPSSIILFQRSIGHCTWRPTYVLLSPATQVSHKTTDGQHSLFLYGCEMKVNNTQRINCCDSTATTVTRTRHNATLYVRCLSCSVFETSKPETSKPECAHRNSCDHAFQNSRCKDANNWLSNPPNVALRPN